MHRWNLRALALAIGCAAFTPGIRADEPAPTPKVVVPVTQPVVVVDPFHAATPYNPTVVRRTAPNPAWNRASFTLPCENSRQNFSSFVPAQPECMKNFFGRSGCGSGCGKHADGDCSQGSCATCGNTSNFIWSGSRSYFGESSREFFERPPSIDAIRHKWNPIPVTNRTEN
jgi:hypothetical protein